MNLADALQEFQKLEDISGGLAGQLRELASKATELANLASRVKDDAARVKTNLDRQSYSPPNRLAEVARSLRAKPLEAVATGVNELSTALGPIAEDLVATRELAEKLRTSEVRSWRG